MRNVRMLSVMLGLVLLVQGTLAAPLLANCPFLQPTTLVNPKIVGSGTLASCTEAALRTQLQGGGHIRFNCGPTLATISLTAQLTISGDTVLDGGGIVALDGGKRTRIIWKPDGFDLTVQNITLQNGRAPGPNGHFTNETGGAIFARGADNTLRVINATFLNNTVTSTSGADIAGGAIYAFGLYEAIIAHSTFINNSASNGGAIGALASGMQIYDSTFRGNQALGTAAQGAQRGYGGVLYMDDVTNSGNPNSHHLLRICRCGFFQNYAGRDGGATATIFSDDEQSQFVVEDSMFVNNTAAGDHGGAIYHVEDDAAGNADTEDARIVNSTFAYNKALRQGGGVWILIRDQGTLVNTTFTGNEVTDRSPNSLGMGGGLALSQGTWTVTNSTFDHNFAAFHGGGIQIAGSESARLTLRNSVFWYNESTRIWAQYQTNRTADTDGGGNLQFPRGRFNQSGSPDDGLVSANAQFSDPLLDSFKDNDGPVWTRGLRTGSPAIDHGASGCPTTDARGATRPQTNCDSGAVEQGVVAPRYLRLESVMPPVAPRVGTQTIILTGHGFAATSVVYLDGAALSTTLLDSSRVRAVVPIGGQAVGPHTLQVRDTAAQPTQTRTLTIRFLNVVRRTYLPMLHQ